MKLFSFLFINLLLISNAVAEIKNTIPIGMFSSENLADWNSKAFSGETDYRLTRLNKTVVLKAESHSAASGLFKEQRIDLQQTPFLNWRWRIDNRLKKNNEQSKSGDDYSVRLYVVISGGWLFWRTKAINYVWASQSAKGDAWPNAFVGNKAMMIALRSSKDKTKTWYQEKRNIMQDLKTQFGTDIRYIDAVAIMTDTDNAKGTAISYYGDIYFSEK